MDHKHISVERLCRLNGEKPSLRDRWYAFYRLYRLSQGHGACQDMAAVDALRTLYSNWAWIRLIETEERSPSRAHIPVFLRKSLLQNEREQRLYNGHYEWKERDKAVAHAVREAHGMEVTPDEVAVIRRKVIDIARARAAEQGINLPHDDEDVLKLLKKE